MNIKDLVGFSKPATKLIEVIAQGVGAVSAPMLIRWTADAKAYEIKTISKAVADSRQLLTDANYREGYVSVSMAAENPVEGLPARAQGRIGFESVKKQINIESVTGYAAENLPDDAEVSPDPVDPDWISRFFNIAQDITSDQMQDLWGRILAGEVKKPGSYSLRTLALLRNLSREEAELFCRAAELNVQFGKGAFIVNPDNYEFLSKVYGLDFNSFLNLKEAGILVTDDVSYTQAEQKASEATALIFGDTVVVRKLTADSGSISLPVLKFTNTGMELLSLVPPKFDLAYAQKVCSLLKRPGVVFEYGPLKRIEADKIHHGPLSEFPNEGFPS